MSAEDFTNGFENKARDSVSHCNIPSRKLELFEKKTDLYAYKNVMQSEQPELIVCYEDDTCHVVKDICIDEGVPFKDKVLIESETDEKLCTIVSSYENKNGSVTKERDDTDMIRIDRSKSSSKSDQNEDDVHESKKKEKEDNKMLVPEAPKSLLEHLSGDDIGNGKESFVLVQTTEANCWATYNIVDGSSRGNFVTFSSPSLRKSSKQKSLKDLLKSPDGDDNEAEQQYVQIPCSSTAKGEGPANVSTEESKRSSSNDSFSNSKVECARISLDFYSKSASTRRAKNPEYVDHEQPLKIGSEQRLLNSDNLVLGSDVQQGHGKASFLTEDPVSGLITFSEPMACSSRVSVRSDGSGTSTGSFAFPVLESEWNSSPVRMVKADGRTHRKRRSWMHGLFCCGL